MIELLRLLHLALVQSGTVLGEQEKEVIVLADKGKRDKLEEGSWRGISLTVGLQHLERGLLRYEYERTSRYVRSSCNTAYKPGMVCAAQTAAMIGAVYTVREQGGEIHLLASDFKDYFERCSRTISARIERAVGVQPGVSERLRATEMESTARIVTGVGMTRDIQRRNGIRQGSEDSCTRSMYFATLCDMMYDKYTVGLPIRIPGGIVGLVQVWVADDAAMPRHTQDLLQVIGEMHKHVSSDILRCELQVSKCGVDAQKFKRGVPSLIPSEVGVLGVEEGEVVAKRIPTFQELDTKTAQQVHCGTMYGATANRKHQILKIERGVGTALTAYGNLGGLTLKELREGGRAITGAYLGFYGRGTPAPDGLIRALNNLRRRAIAGNGFMRYDTSGIMWLSDTGAGGLGMGSTRAMALAPLGDEFLRRGRDEQGSPARAMFEAEIARTGLRLGYEPSRDGRGPLEDFSWAMAASP